MKKTIFCFFLALTFVFSALPASATEDFFFEISYEVPTYSASVSETSITLMSDVYSAFEERILTGWANLETEIDVYDLKITVSQLKSYYPKAFFNNPLYYYVDRSVGGSTQGGYVKTVKPSYLETDKASINETVSLINAASEEILLYISPSMTDFEKAMTIHDYMVLNYSYDEEGTEASVKMLLTKKGVCEGYAKAFLHIMNLLDINCTLVTSDSMGHAWNLVELDNEWYHVDLTWDDPTDDKFGQVRHTYSFLSTTAIQSLSKPHTGFTLENAATSTIYDDADWHDGRSGYGYCDGSMYYIIGKNLVRSDGKVIFENLDQTDGNKNWTVDGRLFAQVFSGICEINGILYFNTENAIHAYNPKTDEVSVFAQINNLCGIFADQNKIRYASYDSDTGSFYDAGSFTVSSVKYADPIIENGSATVRLYKEPGEILFAYLYDNGICKRVSLTDGVNKIDATPGASVFIWDENLSPIFDKQIIE